MFLLLSIMLLKGNNIKIVCTVFVSGVDFQTKMLDVDGQPTALQLWDTAGQERYMYILNFYIVFKMFSFNMSLSFT